MCLSPNAQPAAQTQLAQPSHGLLCALCRYATFAAIAGVDPTDHRAAAAGLPPIDSISHWGHWSGATTPPNGRSARTSLPIGSCNSSGSHSSIPHPHYIATNGFDEWCGSPSDTTTVAGLIVDEGRDSSGGLWKLIVEPQIPMNGWTGPLSPNGTETHYEAWFETECGGARGCLFRLDVDQTEHHDYAAAPANAARLKRMTQQIATLTKGVFSPERGTPQIEAACTAAEQSWHGFWGPWVQ